MSRLPSRPFSLVTGDTGRLDNTEEDDMPIMIEFDGDGGIRSSSWTEDHEHWDDGFDTCGTCGADMGPQQVGRAYAIHRSDGWHIATWDGEVFEVTSNWQSGDRWSPEWVDRRVLLPDGDRNADPA